MSDIYHEVTIKFSIEQYAIVNTGVDSQSQKWFLSIGHSLFQDIIPKLSIKFTIQ